MVASDTMVNREPVGAVTAVIRWHTSYTGDNVLDSAVGVDDLDGAREIARHDDRDIVAGQHKTRRQLLVDHAITNRRTVQGRPVRTGRRRGAA